MITYKLTRRPMLLSGILLSATLMSTGPAMAQQASTPPAPAVTVAKATMEEIADTETFTGRVEAIDHIDILARVSGFVQKIGFEEGGKVSKGTVLFEIEPDSYEAALTKVQGQIKSAEAQRTIADIEVQRQQTLYDKGTVAESILQRAQADQGEIDGTILELQGSLRDAELNLSYTKIIAPFDGRVGLTEISVGAYVTPETGPLVLLSSIDPIWVTFPVAESVLLDYRAKRRAEKNPGEVTATITLANGEDYPEKGKIRIVNVEVQRGTDTVLVRAEFPNPDGALLDGQLVKVKLSDDTGEKSLTIPTLSLQRDQGGYFVLAVDKDKKVAKRSVKVDRIVGPTAVIADGLKEGEEVITEGVQRVRPGIVVDPQLAEAQPKSQ
ncbi:efflux RND transporter periplasmic adaptor subunit [Rhodobacteraceae bacterium NNCM2]|nr:efflux RND transporter periplasmic adaptor subunit [Coraliihabitans acroporae]